MRFYMQHSNPPHPPARKSESHESHDHCVVVPRDSTEFSNASTLVQSARESLDALPQVLSMAEEEMKKLRVGHWLLTRLYAKTTGENEQLERLVRLYGDEFAAQTALINEQQAEIESLRAENEALRVEKEALRAKMGAAKAILKD